MIVRVVIRKTFCWLLLAAAAAGPAAAQSAIGAGPLTRSLADAEPTTNVLDLGRVKIAPGVVVHQIGTDSNVFDEPVDPRDDFVMSVTPDASVFSRLRWAQISAYGALDLGYYHTYASERSVGHKVGGRVDLLLSRLKPYFGAAQLVSRERPNGEIDVRADRREEEVGGGLAYELGPHQSLFGGTFRFRTLYSDAFEEGIALEDSLNRETYTYMGGFRTDLTPLLKMTLSGSQRDDRFDSETSRNSTTRSVAAELFFASDAIVSGGLTIGYTDFVPVDPMVDTFQGILGTMSLTYRLLEAARFMFTGLRSLQYSFDPAEAFYIESNLGLTYTQRLLARWDFQASGNRSIFDYGFHQASPAHRDTLTTWGASFGYNLANRTRIAMNYEETARRSPAFAERNYDRRRIFASWTLGY